MFINHYRILEVTESTNSLLKAEAENGLAVEGTVIQTEHQTAGRGRLERYWEAPPGKALLFSVLLYPNVQPERLTTVGLMVSLAVYDGLIEFLISSEERERKSQNTISLKWPNDILIDDRKICGILCESGVDPHRKRFVVVGIGLNVNQTIEDFPLELRKTTTSLYILSNKLQPRNVLLRTILKHMDKYYSMIKTKETDWIVPAWLSRTGIEGKEITVTQHHKTVSGICVGLEQNGALRIRCKDGEIITVYSGDVISK